MSTEHLRAEPSGPTGSSEKALAAGVLRQAAADLRRFGHAKDAVGRAMYSEAFSWFNAHDPEWPCSFVNVCQLLGLCPQTVLAEVFAEKDSNWFLHSWRAARQLTKSSKTYVSRLVADRKVQHLAVAKS